MSFMILPKIIHSISNQSLCGVLNIRTCPLTLFYDWKKLLHSDWLRTVKLIVNFYFHCNAKLLTLVHLQASQL